MPLSLFISELDSCPRPPPLPILFTKENFSARWKILTEFEIEILVVLNQFTNIKADTIAKHLKRNNDATLRCKLADLKEKLIIISCNRNGYSINL
jgi:hypothetical protein